MEGLTTIIDYKNKHPVVVDYLNEYPFDTKSPTAGEDFLAILSSLSGNTEEKQNQKNSLLIIIKIRYFLPILSYSIFLMTGLIYSYLLKTIS